MSKRKASAMAAINENTQRLEVLLRDYAVINEELKDLVATTKIVRTRKKQMEDDITEALNADRRKQYQTADMSASVELRPFKKQTRITNDMAMEAFLMTVGGSNQELKDAFMLHLENLKEERKEMTERLQFKAK